MNGSHVTWLSHQMRLTRSLAQPRRRKRWPLWGSALKTSCTKAERPWKPLRISRPPAPARSCSLMGPGSCRHDHYANNPGLDRLGDVFQTFQPDPLA